CSAASKAAPRAPPWRHSWRRKSPCRGSSPISTGSASQPWHSSGYSNQSPEDVDMRLTFHGAARQVTGSCFAFEVGHSRFLVDCGLFQGARATREANTAPFAFEPAELDF